jgi:hypothetical protein
MAKVICATIWNPKLGYDLDLWKEHIQNQTRLPDEIHIEPDPEKFDYWDKNVSYARERCRLKALREGYDYLWFVDVDVLVPPHALETLLKMNVDMASGKYRHKEDGVPFFWYYEYVPLERREETKKKYGHPVVFEDVIYLGDEPRRVNKVGTGCLLISRKVFEKVAFPMKIPKQWTEDVIYSVMADLVYGFEIWAVPTVDCKHIGPSYQPLKIERGGIPIRRG